MTQKNKPTKDEHFIPQFYLRQFSPDGIRIYQYNKLTKKSSKLVPINSICFMKNLYEFKREDETIVLQNLIENTLKLFEGKISEIIEAIKSRVDCEDSFYTLYFLSDEEQAFLIFFMAIQILRDPEILKLMKATAMECFGDMISEKEAHNLALMLALPIYKELNREEKNALNPILEMFEDKSIQVAVAKKDLILTSDNPILLHGTGKNNIPIEIIFPLTSKIVIYMKSINLTEPERVNRLVSMTNDFATCINQETVLHSRKWVYSKTKISESQINVLMQKEQII